MSLSPRKIISILLVAALAVGNYALSYEDFKSLLIFAGFVFAYMAVHVIHEDGVERGRERGREKHK